MTKAGDVVDGATPPPRRLTKAQRAAAIGAAYEAGELSLAEALSHCFVRDVGVPSSIRWAVIGAFLDYQDGKAEDLAVLFGIAQSYGQRKRSPWRRKKGDDVKPLVNAAHEFDGFPLSPPDGETRTAFHVVADKLGLSPATVHRYYYAKKK